MLRSEINEIIRQGREYIASFGFTLPPFADWSPRQMAESQSPAIVESRLGWDITDYGQDKFNSLGLLLFTLRNGSADNLKSGKGMLYAEKLMISRKNQLSPMHRHITKTEDIINRGGGRLVLELFMADQNGNIDHGAAVEVPSDGVITNLPPGGLLSLNPGQSVTLLPGVWHAFQAEDDDVLIGEVSTVNDDQTDNVFAEQIERFSEIEEDTHPLHLLVSDYEKWCQ